MKWQELSHKNIVIWGKGKEGLSVEKALKKYVPESQISFVTDEDLSPLSQADVIVKSPGVSLYKKELQHAIKQGVLLTSSTNLFFANKSYHTKVIAVTGTKGKSTTSSLLFHTLKTAGKNVALAGNIGTPLLELLDENYDIVIAELSSYQCADFRGNPDIAILNNLYHEHIEWHGAFETYYQDKIHMVSQAKMAVLNAESNDILLRTQHINSKVYFNHTNSFYIKDDFFYYVNRPLFSIKDLNLKGFHNAQNACAVLAVANLFGVSFETCQKSFQTFQSLPHRLQVVFKFNNVSFVDDSISTTPETALAALKAFDNGNNHLTLIVGGLDRNQNHDELILFLEQISNRVTLICMPDTGKDVYKLAQHKIPAFYAHNMEEAVHFAINHTPQGGTILLSPAAPSYNMYKNFEERGLDFLNNIKKNLI